MSNKAQYEQKFRSIWLNDPQLKDWLTVVDSTQGQRAKCKRCNSYLSNKYSSLKLHSESKKHKDMMKTVFSRTQQKIPFKTVAELSIQREAEAQLSLYAACHTSLNACDHLINICKKSFKGHTAADHLQMHRTKCTNIIKHVLAPHFITDLRNDIGDSPYSLLIDESTDISITKFLGIIIIYRSNKLNRIVETFLDMPKLEECNAEAIVSVIKTTLRKYSLSIENLRGLGTDNASVMVGINNGVYTKLKEEIPHLVLVRCVCHSLQLAVSDAATNCLPRHIDFLIKETYNWFSHSSVRQEKYKQIFETMNNGQEPLKIIQSCQTRWLSIESAVSRILQQWIELKTFFQITRSSEKCFLAETLFSLYNNEINFATMSFLRATLTDIQKVNKLFESNNADPTKLHTELLNLLRVLVSRITLPHARVDIFTTKIEDHVDKNCYLGFGFENCIRKLRENNSLKREDEENLRGRLIHFIISLINQIRNRFPKNFEVLEKISFLSVSNALMHNKNSLVPLLKHFDKSDFEIDDIERQWQSIHLLKWNETNDTKHFWNEVYNFKDAEGENPFIKLASFAFEMLVLPYSNAEVERLFSKLNNIKTKLRNRLNPDTVEAILHIKCGLKRYQKCCDQYTLPEDVLSKIKSKETYLQTEFIDVTSYSEMLNVLNDF